MNRVPALPPDVDVVPSLSLSPLTLAFSFQLSAFSFPFSVFRVSASQPAHAGRGETHLTRPVMADPDVGEPM